MSSLKSSAPTIGALLRIAHQEVSQKLADWLSSSAYRDVQPAHCAAVHALWNRPEGVRLTAMAKTARISKQSMAALVEHLIERGYVERADDPEDGRASRLRLTARGKVFGVAVRAYGHQVEAEWSGRVGARRIRELRETLTLIVAARVGDTTADL
jgi:DNA-binding MarR family transcriptional regulator